MRKANKARLVLSILAACCLIFGLVLADEKQAPTKTDTAKQPAAPPAKPAVSDTTTAAAQAVTDKVIVTYFHGNRRCPTCRKLEAFSQEAITTAFTDKLEKGNLEWRVVNFEDEGNEHFVKDYQLFSQSLILSRTKDGKETGWKNLDKIWELVGDKDKFLAYVQTETKAFIGPDGK